MKNITSALLIIFSCGFCLAQEINPNSIPNPQSKNLHDIYIRPAEAGNSFAQLAIGTFYDTGEGVVKDQQQAIRWYRKAAENGQPYAQFTLAWKYLEGDGVSKDIAQAKDWFQKAADNGSADAQSKLGEMYFNGVGIAKDSDKAIFWYRKAAEQGNGFAQNNLGYIYANGKGVARNIVEGYKWFSISARGGNDKLQEILQALEKQMSVEQLADAKMLVTNLGNQIDAAKTRLAAENAKNALKIWGEIEKTNRKN